MSSPSVECVIAEGYKGDVSIIEDDDGAEPELVDGKMIFRIPASGELRAKSVDVFFDWHKADFKYESGDPIPLHNDPEKPGLPVIKDQIYYFYLRTDNNPRSAHFFVGTPYDHELRTTYKAVHKAVRDSSLAGLEMLIKNGFDINETNSDGYTPFHVAILRKDAQMITTLIRLGADTGRRTPDGKTPRQVARSLGLNLALPGRQADGSTQKRPDKRD
jgi:hypothetical protein